MASLFGFHPNYLSSLLKKGTGKSFKQLLQLQRISQAALFLSNSSLSIPEISEKVGYSSITFSRNLPGEICRLHPLRRRPNEAPTRSLLDRSVQRYL
ncbi:helix-turn-helix domain-containing protein [Paenibacillus polymyxa]